MDRISFRLNLERKLLGACFFDRDAFKDISAKLSQKDFKYKHHKIIFETFEYLNLLNAPINVKNVTTVLMDKNKLEDGGGVEYLLQLNEYVKNTNNLDLDIDSFIRLSIKETSFTRRINNMDDNLKTNFDLETVQDVFHRCIVTDMATCDFCPYKHFNTNEADCSCINYLQEDVDCFLSELLDDYIIKGKI